MRKRTELSLEQTKAIIASGAAPHQLLAAAIISQGIRDCEAGDHQACMWIMSGQGGEWLSLLIPAGVSEEAFFERLRQRAPEVLQLQIDWEKAA